MQHKQPSKTGAFTLVEIALAIAILAFSCIPLLTLVPNGLTQFRGAMNLSITTQIAQGVINDAQQTDFDLLIDRRNLPQNAPLAGYTFRAPSVGAPEFRYFDEQGTEIVPASSEGLSNLERRRIIYQVNTRIQPQASVPSTAIVNSSVAAASANLALVTVQIAVAPGSRELAISTAPPQDAASPGRNLINPQPGLQIYTYTAYVGRGL